MIITSNERKDLLFQQFGPYFERVPVDPSFPHITNLPYNKKGPPR